MFATRQRALPIPTPRQESGTNSHRRTHSLSLTIRSEEKEGSFLWMTNEKDYRYLIIVCNFHRLTNPGQDRSG